MLLVHIGLGKTATTTMQKHVFPELAKSLGCTYNDPIVYKILGRASLFPLSQAEMEIVHSTLKEGNHIISLESLVGWNPVTWEEFSERNVSLFGKDAIILITMREPLEWITSVYQEMVHEGNVVDPREFFVNNEQWRLANRISSRYRLEYLNVDAVNFRMLHKFYSARFSRVVVVDSRKLAELNFLGDALHIDCELREKLKRELKGKRLHRSYSASAMFLTLSFERILRVFRVATNGSQTKRLMNYQNILSPQELGSLQGGRSFDEKFSRIQKIKRWFAVRIIPKWSSFIKGGYDRIIPYKKYSLPKDVYLNHSLLEENRRFLEEET